MKSEMVEIDDAALRNFRLIYEKVYGESIGYEEGKQMAFDFLGFIKYLLGKPNLDKNRPNDVYEKRIQETTTK